MALSLLIILMPGLCLLIPANGKNNITQKALEMINSGKVYRYADQDVLNILLNGRVHYLDKKYNNKTTLSVRCDEEQKTCPTQL